MSKLFHPLLVLIATATENELAKSIQYLKEENRILREKAPGRIPLTDQERQRLIKFGLPLGAAIREVITIVHYRTFQRWVAKANDSASPRNKSNKIGRPRTPESLREPVVKIAKETGWGAGRICGELKKLGFGRISRSTVLNILKEHNLDPALRRGPGSWYDFIQRHRQTLAACDFFTKKIMTTHGIVEMYLLVFIHIGSRRIWVSRATANPHGDWIAQQARNMCMAFEDEGLKLTRLLHDRDTKFTKQFDGIFESSGVKAIKLPYQSPHLNGYCERVVQTIKHEALDYFIVFGEDHLHHIVSEFVNYYHTVRPHQGLGNLPLGTDVPEKQTNDVESEEIVCRRSAQALRANRRVAESDRQFEAITSRPPASGSPLRRDSKRTSFASLLGDLPTVRPTFSRKTTTSLLPFQVAKDQVSTELTRRQTF